MKVTIELTNEDVKEIVKKYFEVMYQDTELEIKFSALIEGWQENNGVLPFESGSVDVTLRSGEVLTKENVSDLEWSLENRSDDIISFRKHHKK